MSIVRYLVLLSLVVWLGGLIFFAFVLAPTVFTVLPTRHMAGNVVARSLGSLHWIGIVCGVVFLISSIVSYEISKGTPRLFAARHVLIVLMLLLTCVSQFAIMPRMDSLRASIGEIDTVPIDNPVRMQFDALHVWSTRVEGGVLLLGLVVVYLAASS